MNWHNTPPSYGGFALGLADTPPYPCRWRWFLRLPPGFPLGRPTLPIPAVPFFQRTQVCTTLPVPVTYYRPPRTLHACLPTPHTRFCTLPLFKHGLFRHRLFRTTFHTTPLVWYRFAILRVAAAPHHAAVRTCRYRSTPQVALRIPRGATPLPAPPRATLPLPPAIYGPHFPSHRCGHTCPALRFNG